MKKFLLVASALTLILFSFTACKKQTPVIEETSVEETIAELLEEEQEEVLEVVESGEEVKSIYRTPEEWALRYKIPTYEENKEIVGEELEKLKASPSELVATCRTGSFVGVKDDDVLMWKGIPYAKAPTGELRFKRAETPDDSDKYYEAYYFGKAAIQTIDLEEKASQYEQGEDCLSLNIWTSTNEEGRSPMYRGKKKPVFVYIHGGGWVQGGSSDPLYDGWNFAHYNPDILVATINYRIGGFGAINLTNISTSSYPTSTGNNVLDQVTALKWIYENIEAFGGDPENINVAGESAGGGSVSFLCTIPEARKYMKKAMPMSGGVNQATDIKLTNNLQNVFTEKFNVSTPEDIANIKEEDIKKWWQEEGHSCFHHIVNDGTVISENPIEAWENGDTKDLLVLQGHTSNEFKYYLQVFAYDEVFFQAFCDTIVEEYLASSSEARKEAYNEYKDALLSLGYKEEDITKEFANDYTLAYINTYQASMHAKNGGRGYSYTFDKSYDGKEAQLGAAHAIDCFYLFGNFDGEGGEGTDEEVEISKTYQKMLSNFCLNGNPSTEDIEWPKYNEDTRYKMMFGDTIRVEENPEKARVEAAMKMSLVDGRFLQLPTIPNTIAHMYEKNPKMVEAFLYRSNRKKENVEIVKKAFETIEYIYEKAQDFIDTLTDEEKEDLLHLFYKYVAVSTDSNVERAVEAYNELNELGETTEAAEITTETVVEETLAQTETAIETVEETAVETTIVPESINE